MKRAGKPRITVKTGVRPEVPKVVPTAVKIRVEETPESLLRQIEDELPKVPNIIEKLISMEDKEGRPILNVRNRENIFTVIGMLEFIDIDAMEIYFSSRKFNEQAIWDSSIFDRERAKENLDADILLNRVRVKRGIVECTRCKSDNVIYYDKQVRGADEPPTLFFTCLNCNLRWKTG